MIDSVLRGDSLVLFQEDNRALVIDTKGYTGRSITEPQAESVIRGPREGFSEILMVNLELVRMRISNSELKIEMIVGISCGSLAIYVRKGCGTAVDESSCDACCASVHTCPTEA